MGCGKSSVGRRLSELLCCSFVDLDEVIVELEGRSIPEIFETEGEQGFRQIELEVLREMLHADDSESSDYRNDSKRHLIIALGGGTVMTPECAELVHSETLCIYLRASIETLVEHLEGEAEGRPMLAGDLKRRIETLMQQRSATYENTAHVIIDTDGKSVEAITSEMSNGQLRN